MTEDADNRALRLKNPGERGLPAPGLSHFPVHRHDRNRGLCQHLPLWNRR